MSLATLQYEGFSMLLFRLGWFLTKSAVKVFVLIVFSFWVFATFEAAPARLHKLSQNISQGIIHVSKSEEFENAKAVVMSILGRAESHARKFAKHEFREWQAEYMRTSLDVQNSLRKKKLLLSRKL